MDFTEKISSQPWKKKNPPLKILVIRIEALGDCFALLPFVYDLKFHYPNCRLDLLTHTDYAEFFNRFTFLDRVYPLKGGRRWGRRWLYLALLFPFLFFRRYHLVLDLQRNKHSRLLRKALFPPSWAEFDRFSPRSALLRYQWSINQAGLTACRMNTSFCRHFIKEDSALALLQQKGWERQSPLFIFNPAGAFITRNWPLDRYVAFAGLWLAHYPATRFVLLGVAALLGKAAYLEEKLRGHLISLVGQTSLPQAYQVVLEATFMLTEDSGLGHFSWISGKKTLMLLGSTRSDWTSPFGEHTACFTSSDLPCGDCMRAQCIHPQVLCMERLLPQMVFEKAIALMEKN